MMAADTPHDPKGPRMPAQGRPRLDDSFAVRAARRIRSIPEKKENAMSPKTNVPDLADLSDEALDREVLSNARTMAVSQRDPHGSRPTREEGQRRLDSLSETIEAQTEDLAREIAIQLARGGGDVSLGTLAKFASLVALADPAHPAWASLEAEVSAPDRPDRGPVWSTTTDAEREGQKSEARNVYEAALARSVVLAAERERRRQVAEAVAMAEQLARYRARSRVS